MSSVERSMDTTLPGTVMEDFTVDKQVPVNTTLSKGTNFAIEQHAKEKNSKGKGGFIKRAWKAVKRPFRRSSHETNVEAMVPDPAIPCTSDGEEIRVQQSSVSGPCKVPTTALPPKEDRCDDLDVVSITSSDWSVICNNIQQNSEPPADASAEDVGTEPQEQHVKDEKKDHIDFSLRPAIFVDAQRWKLAKLRIARNVCRSRWEYYMFIRRCPHHKCCHHAHLCCLRNDTIFLGVREQLMSTVPSVTRPFLIFPKQYRNEQFRVRNPEDDDIKEEGIFKRKWKAVKRRLFRWESRRTLLQKDMQKHVFDFQESTYIEQIIYERPYLSVPPMFQPSKESFDSSYSDENVILGRERFGQVCLATRLSDGQKVAYKECNRYYYCTSTYIMAGYTERLMNEVAIMPLLKQPPISPYIIQMLEWFHEEFHTFIILEDPGSWTVLDKIMKLHALDEKVARVIMRQAVQAAQHCIAHGVFHYYIDEENILINTSTLDIKLIDFGYSMPYTGKIYYRLGDTLEDEEKHPEWYVPGYDYSASSVNACQLGALLSRMVYGPRGHPLHISFQISNECMRLIDWCSRYEMTERPTLDQILQHRWFTKE
ncbi:uncharacterized protein LOC130432429 isoform X2 [Triplophysa dalaica]|uniref:uncharacterized protein LOC130432429 isoform X2 n=1 Tax=Triplophysa dalaica TaxID=1582913 RepID=UPI0024DFB3BE|nr:uncharacterized protein LOC130432429 isoform X2 [Triplophysa dalaica]